jgi:hypothetical protein
MREDCERMAVRKLPMIGPLGSDAHLAHYPSLTV